MRLKISVVLLLACRALCATLEQIVLANGDFKSSNMIESHDFGLFVRAVMDKWAVQGLSVAVVRVNSSGVWEHDLKGWGVADRFDTRITENTRFNIASNSKHFTAIALGLLIENDTWSDIFPRGWNTKVHQVIPEWLPQDPFLRDYGDFVDILSHRSGLPRHDYSYYAGQTHSDVVTNVKYLRPSAELRKASQYNNIMYVTAAYIVSKLSGMPYPAFVEDHLFKPLGLGSTTFNISSSFKSGTLAEGFSVSHYNVSDGEGWQKNKYRPTPYWMDESSMFNAGAGGIISCGKDLAVWLQTLLSGGHHPVSNESIIPESILEHITTPAMVYSPVAKYPEVGPIMYGAGQMMYHYQGRQLIEHGGSTPGFRSQMTRFPDDKLGVVVLANSDTASPAIDIIKYRIAEMYLGLPHVDWDGRKTAEIRTQTQELSQTLLPRPSDANSTAIPLEALLGQYHHPAYGSIELCPLYIRTSSGSFSPPKLTSFCDKVIASSYPILSSHLLPNVSESTLRLIAHFPRVWFSHLVFTHFSNDTFNITAFNVIRPAEESTAKDPDEEPFALPWGLDDQAPTMTFSIGVEDASDVEEGEGTVVKGFGWRDMWGAGDGISSPSGPTIKEQSEVWFDRVHL